MNITPNKPRGIYILPNLFTVASIFSGFFAIVSAFKGSYETGIIAIFIAMIMDSLDGRIARLTNTSTAFGAQFDSMADMVSFAVAPAFLAYAWGLHSLGKLGWIAAFVYTVAVALRLARFNTQVDGSGKRYFQGLPCPTAAAVVIGFIWVYQDFAQPNPVLATILALITILVALLMVSNVRYRSFKDTNLKNNVRFVAVLAMVLIIALVSIVHAMGLFTIFAAYTISGPVATIWGLHQRRRSRRMVRHHDTGQQS